MSANMINVYRVCVDCEHEYHRSLKFCPKCYAWSGRPPYPYWICNKCDTEMLTEEKDSHVCCEEPVTEDEDIIFRLAKLLADSQRVLRDASHEINRLRGEK